MDSPAIRSPEKVAAKSEKLNFAPIYLEANKMPGAASSTEATQKHLLADFQRQFMKLASDTGPVTAWGHFCTPDFTMSARLYGEVRQKLTREQFLEAVRNAKKSDEDSGPALFGIFLSVRAAESGVKDDDTKLTYAAADKFESRGEQIVYSNFPVATFTGKDSGVAKAVFEETFVKQGNGLLLKRHRSGESEPNGPRTGNAQRAN